MPVATPQATQNKVVELYKAGKTYSQIQQETGVKGPIIAKIVDKAGVPKRKSAAAPASTPAAAPAPATPAASPPPSSTVPSSQALADLQPPPPPAPKKNQSQTYRCDACSGVFTLDPGESIETVLCPHCGGKP